MLQSDERFFQETEIGGKTIMKRAGAFICVLIMTVMLMAPGAFAADGDADAAAAKTSLEMLSSSPEDGATGVAVDNLSVKIRFNKDVMPASDQIKKANAKQFKMVDAEGSKIPVKVYYSEKDEGMILVAADVYSSGSSKNRIKGDENYTLTIGRNFQATDGSTTGQQISIGMTTLNQGRSTAIYMVLMILMMAGMVFFTLRSTKKAEQKKKEEREYKEGVNPYKEAKKSGKSVEEVVAKQSKKKAKKEEALRRQKEAEAAIEAEIIEKIRKESNKRVAAPRPITSAGSTLTLKVTKDSGEKVSASEIEAKAAERKNNKGTTNPKNQSGKSRNKKNKGKGKKKK